MTTHQIMTGVLRTEGGIDRNRAKILARRALMDDINPVHVEYSTAKLSRPALPERKTGPNEKPVIDPATRETWPSASHAADAIGGVSTPKKVRNACHLNKFGGRNQAGGRKVMYLEDFERLEKYVKTEKP